MVVSRMSRSVGVGNEVRSLRAIEVNIDNTIQRALVLRKYLVSWWNVIGFYRIFDYVNGNLQPVAIPVRSSRRQLF